MFSFIIPAKNNDNQMFNEVIVFGAGQIGKSVIYMLRLKNIIVQTCFDNNHEVSGKSIWEDISCETPRLIDRYIPILLAVDNEAAKREMRSQCETLGYMKIYDINVIQLLQCINQLPDEDFIKLQFWLRCGQPLNLENPKTFNEKLQWLKLNDRNPLYTQLVDKYAVKKYVGDLIGEEYIIPTIGVWDSFAEIDFDKLPDQFVLKCTHDSGSTVVCKDKNTFNRKRAEEDITRCLQRNFYYCGREWPYKNVPPRILAEKYMVDESGTELKDYKFFCFNGIAKALFIASDRLDENVDTKFDFYDMDFIHLPFTHGHPNSNKNIEKPLNFDMMRELAEKLSSDIPHVRIDFYNIMGRVYFGEMTFFHHCGWVPFEPYKWDETFGEWLNLESIEKSS